MLLKKGDKVRVTQEYMDTFPYAPRVRRTKDAKVIKEDGDVYQVKFARGGGTEYLNQYWLEVEKVQVEWVRCRPTMFKYSL